MVAPPAAWICTHLPSILLILLWNCDDSCRVSRELAGEACYFLVLFGKNDGTLRYDGCKICATIQISRSQVASRLDAIDLDVAGDGGFGLVDDDQGKRRVLRAQRSVDGKLGLIFTYRIDP